MLVNIITVYSSLAGNTTAIMRMHTQNDAFVARARARVTLIHPHEIVETIMMPLKIHNWQAANRL